MLVYGKNIAKEYLKKNSVIEKIIIQDNFKDKEIISLMEKLKIRPKVLPKKEIDRLCSGLHQGIILDVSDYQYKNLDGVLENSNLKTVVLLDHIEDPHNLGAIIRTCEAAGIKTIIIPKKRQVLVNPTVIKTSVGTVNQVDIVLVSNVVNTINKLQEKGFWVVGTSLEATQNYLDIDYQDKICLVIGNEGAGISKLVLEKCDYLVKIPMYGTTNSLNASVAAGIMIYEIIRNRK